MIRKAAWLILLLLAPLGLLTCDDSCTCPALTEAPSQGALLMAMGLSGELRPPQSLARTIDSDLLRIRSRFGHLDPRIDTLSFFPPWVPSCVIVGVDTATASQMRAGSYTAWNDLNQTYHVNNIKVSRPGYSFAYVLLSFEEILHPGRLAEMYRHLPGVRYTEPNHYVGDWPNIYPRLLDSERTYLFRDAGGDCPAGCTENWYWYFKIGPLGPAFIGYWDAQEQPRPDWWDDARRNFELYWSW